MTRFLDTNFEYNLDEYNIINVDIWMKFGPIWMKDGWKLH